MTRRYEGFIIPFDTTKENAEKALDDPCTLENCTMLGVDKQDCGSTLCDQCLYYKKEYNQAAFRKAVEEGIFEVNPEPKAVMPKSGALWTTWTVPVQEVDPETEDADLDAQENDPVAHPAHYCVGGLECIDIMERVFGTEAVKTFCRLNAFKYLFRSENKNGRQDIDKAHWYTGKYGELCDKTPIAPLKGARSDEQIDAIKSAILRLVDTAQEEARKDCEPTLAVWDAVDKLYEALGI